MKNLCILVNSFPDMFSSPISKQYYTWKYSKRGIHLWCVFYWFWSHGSIHFIFWIQPFRPANQSANLALGRTVVSQDINKPHYWISLHDNSKFLFQKRSLFAFPIIPFFLFFLSLFCLEESCTLFPSFSFPWLTFATNKPKEIPKVILNHITRVLQQLLCQLPSQCHFTEI